MQRQVSNGVSIGVVLYTFPKRTVLLGGTAVLLAILLLARWISDWGLVTIHVEDAPLAKVTASIARQGHIAVETSLDPSMKVSMDADRVTAIEAVDQLAQITDSSWRAVIVAAPTKSEVAEGVSMLRAAPVPEGWDVHHYPVSPALVPDETVLDPGLMECGLEGPDTEVAKLLDQAAQKSGVMILIPKDWNATISHLPATGATGKIVHELVRSARGRDASFYYLTARERRRREEAPPSRDGSTEPPTPSAQIPDSMTGTPPPLRPATKPEWLDQRIVARIKALPAEKQLEAKKEYEEGKTFRDSLRDLPPEERRIRMRERMSNPEIAERMGERFLLRESNKTAQQRISRAVNYLNRKASALATQSR
jgi:hypothetical protein